MLRILLTIVFIYLAYQWVLKPLLRIFIQYALKRFIDGQLGKNKNNPEDASNKRSKPEGSINIDYIPKDKKSTAKANSDDGEYVDYEEVK